MNEETEEESAQEAKRESSVRALGESGKSWEQGEECVWSKKKEESTMLSLAETSSNLRTEN